MPELAQNNEHIVVIINYLNSIENKENYEESDLNSAFQIFSLLFESITESPSINFKSLFARIAYAGVKNQFPGYLNYKNQQLRKLFEQEVFDLSKINEWSLYAYHIIWLNINQLFNKAIPKKFRNVKYPIDDWKNEKLEYKRIVKILLLNVDENDDLVFIDEDYPEFEKKGSIKSEAFLKQIHNIKKYVSLPITLNLIDVQISKEEYYNATAFVFDPDMLIGVTSISECFEADGQTALKYLSRKLIPTKNSIHMVIGNIVNFYLDELIYNPELKYEEILQKTFQIAPLTFAKMTDGELRTTLSKIKTHFFNLKKVVKEELTSVNISKDKAYLEPSFFSSEYGLQGRLDLYHYDEKSNQSDIVELKSGKLYKANNYGLNENHYIQTLLYDLIIESIYKGKIKSSNYILYSNLDQKRLRYAPKVRKKQMDAIRLRNDIVFLENLLCTIDEENQPEVLKRLDPETIPKIFSFLKRDTKYYFDAFENLDEIEKEYVKVYMAFISREHHLSKTGLHGLYKSNGLAALWLDPLQEKIDNFNILSFLKIEKNETDADVPLIHLCLSEKSNLLSRFRVGDIGILYPFDGTEKSALNNQLFKCTILKIHEDKLTVRLRARQKNSTIFNEFEYWHIEGDVLDSGFNKMYHGLYEFMTSDKNYRNQILCLTPPAQSIEEKHYSNSKLTEEQTDIINAAISSEDYYLLWGPPGTGKTSVMIKSLVDYYYNQTNQNILLLAYTNRAVDEICAAVDDLLSNQFIRIGSRYSTNEKYFNNLLSVQTETITKRKELSYFFQNKRIFISTISSFQSNLDYRSICDFDLVIIDEASQVLEPMLCGLLSSFKKFIFIGDHKQLPAVVTQAESKSLCKKNELKEKLGLQNLRISLFERMYKQCISNQWTWAYGALTYQGRMHADILKFISPQFYNNGLKILDKVDRLNQKPNLISEDPVKRNFIEHRMIFINTEMDFSILQKTNKKEAVLTNKILNIWSEIYAENDLEIHSSSIGVITPFRSQIAMIKDNMSSNLESDKITIDTIERYQGGARDRIIISLAVNQANLLDSITNISEEGIDRKLNVALTRAKEHIVILGSKEILKSNKAYAALIDYCQEVSL